ncbi:MAG: hypothetical protein GX620_03900 [Chloroflexi bacterium]|mgnify:FL=1|nr:hypothetical protein [Chloroflexota bacterium]
MSITVREYANMLCRKFHFEETRRTGHTFFVLRIEGLPPVRTMASHNRKQDIGRQLESKLARELRVSTAFFRDMFSCTKSCRDYCDWLRERHANGMDNA